MPAGPVLVAAAAALVLSAAGAAGAPQASSESCSFASPKVLAEPPHTRGESNIIRWEHVPKSCWIGEDNAGRASTQRRFTVTVTNVASGRKATITVDGEDEVDATIGPSQLPRGDAGEIDGVLFEYVVVRKEKWCSSGSPSLGICQVTSTRTSLASAAVRSTQDSRAPSGSLVLAGGALFVGSLEVAARVEAVDPGGAAASGVGFVAFTGAGQRSGCGRLASCAEPLAPGLTVRLPPGDDRPRIVEAVVYDRARGPGDDPGSPAIGAPPGNVSQPFRATVTVDRTPPHLFMRISTVRVAVGTPVTFDASASVDLQGSGILPQSGSWTFGDGATAGGLAAAHTYTRTGRFTLGFSVSDQVGNVTAAPAAEIEVVAAPVPAEPRSTETPPAAPAPTAVDRRAPALNALALRRRGGRVTIAFRLSERAVVRVEVRRRLPRPVRRIALLSRQLEAGSRRVALPPAATAKPGRYAVVLVARDRSGNVSRARTLTLTVR